MKAVKIGLVALAFIGTSSPASAWPDFTNYDVYGYTFYSDASHTTVVGHGRTRCDGHFDYSGTYYITSGSNSGYYDMEQIGICTENGLEPY